MTTRLPLLAALATIALLIAAPDTVRAQGASYGWDSSIGINPNWSFSGPPYTVTGWAEWSVPANSTNISYTLDLYRWTGSGGGWLRVASASGSPPAGTYSGKFSDFLETQNPGLHKLTGRLTYTPPGGTETFTTLEDPYYHDW
jgi:hypothetical protein